MEESFDNFEQLWEVPEEEAAAGGAKS